MTKRPVSLKGKVIKATRNKYLVQIGAKMVSCFIRGKIVGASKWENFAVKVGDDVRIKFISQNEGVIQEILPRWSKLSRAVERKAYKEHVIAVNIDQIVIIMSVKEPEFKSGLLDRYLVIAEKNHLKASICLNKVDLMVSNRFDEIARWYAKMDYPFYFTSAKTNQGLLDFKSILKNRVSILVGQSGVGKSSLIKKIEPDLNLKVKETSLKTSKGKHTTSHVELFPLHIGGYLIDTPGVRELGLWDIYQNELKEYFVDFQPYEGLCQFADCMHLKEPGCAIKSAVDQGKIFLSRYISYQKIYYDLRVAPYELIKRR
jgi:ribosome biogenesis GTPase